MKMFYVCRYGEIKWADEFIQNDIEEEEQGELVRRRLQYNILQGIGSARHIDSEFTFLGNISRNVLFAFL